MEAPGLLVTLAVRPGLRSHIARGLPSVPFRFVSEVSESDGAYIRAILCGSLSRELPREAIERLTRLEFIQQAFTGLDGFPFEWLSPSVAVAGNVGGYAPYVAEHAIALILASAKAVRSGHEQVREGRLRPVRSNRTLIGKTVLILGFGAIGHDAADRLRPFGVRIIALTRTGQPVDGVDQTFPANRLGDALAVADVIIDARPLTSVTRRSIGEAEFARLRPEAIYVNVGRAATVDEKALFEHLSSHPECRAAFDPWWEEDYVGGTIGHRFPLADLPNFLGTPHTAAIVPGSFEYALDTALANLARFFQGDGPRHVVDRSEYEG